jgi:hypothetical protein
MPVNAYEIGDFTNETLYSCVSDKFEFERSEDAFYIYTRAVKHHMLRTDGKGAE